MTAAKNAAEFESAWNVHIGQVSGLAHSLASKEALEMLALVERLKGYVKIASDRTYGKEGES